jgi:DMSO reductase anchor subunit
LQLALRSRQLITSAVFAFNVGFYALPFGEKVGFDASFATLAAINAVLLLPLIYMVFKGEKIREKQGLPKEHGDL